MPPPLFLATSPTPFLLVYLHIAKLNHVCHTSVFSTLILLLPLLHESAKTRPEFVSLLYFEFVPISVHQLYWNRQNHFPGTGKIISLDVSGGVARGAFSLTLTCRTILPLSFGGDSSFNVSTCIQAREHDCAMVIVRVATFLHEDAVENIAEAVVR